MENPQYSCDLFLVVEISRLTLGFSLVVMRGFFLFFLTLVILFVAISLHLD